MKVLVLGATGFVGTNVLPSLQSQGVEVISVGRHAPTPAAGGSAQWMSQCEALSKSVPDLDAVWCLAGVGNPNAFEANPSQSAAAELDIANCVVALATLHAVPSVVYLSTAGAAYGEGWRQGEPHRFLESDTCQPTSVYGRSKLAAEDFLIQQMPAKAPDARLTIFRASNIYGPRYAKAGQQGLVNALIERARARQAITVFGDGLVYRDYLYASDLAEALLSPAKTTASGIFNIAFGQSHSILEVIEAVEQVMDMRFDRVFAPARPFDVKYSALSVSKARRELGWKPHTDLLSGISLILERSLHFPGA
jgi:UDP-glucose 4-epimerase